MNSRRMSPAATRELPAATRQLLAATRRQDVAMGASPWTSSPQLAFSPEGTTGASFHSAPLACWGGPTVFPPLQAEGAKLVGERLVTPVCSLWSDRA
ncbi:MAG: hypothetical protein K9M08_12425 [Pirellula sp.]|nr:hypothetical protein [Pirellula sp.]